MVATPGLQPWTRSEQGSLLGAPAAGRTLEVVDMMPWRDTPLPAGLRRMVVFPSERLHEKGRCGKSLLQSPCRKVRLHVAGGRALTAE